MKFGVRRQNAPPEKIRGNKKPLMRAFAIDTFFRWFGKHAPHTRWGDRFKSCSRFYRTHGRMPTDAMLLNDYLHRLKLSDEMLSPLRTFTSDKELVKVYIAAKVGVGYNVPTIAVLRSKAEIRDFDFPADCVIKPTHASDRYVFRMNNSALDIAEICSWMDLNYYSSCREINYKYLTPKIIVEPFVFDGGPSEDIKVFCYKGEPRVINCTFQKQQANTRRFYTTDWQDLNMSMGFPLATETRPRPGNLDEMLEVSRVLSRDFSFVRIDFYHSEEKLYVGEITHVQGAATQKFHPPEAEQVISELIFGPTG